MTHFFKMMCSLHKALISTRSIKVCVAWIFYMFCQRLCVCVCTWIMWAKRGSLRCLLLMSSRAWDCWQHSWDACSWNSSPAAPSNYKHTQTVNTLNMEHENMFLLAIETGGAKQTLVSITSPMSWTIGDSLRFFIASHRLAANERHKSLEMFKLIMKTTHGVFLRIRTKLPLSEGVQWSNTECLHGSK